MKKGVNALELVFGLFILIIVTLVVIRFVMGVFEKNRPQEMLTSFQQSFNYEKQLNLCTNLCNSFKLNPESLKLAVDFCSKKVEVDIDGNTIPNQPEHYGIVNLLPYCEDGLYCFHIHDTCSSGSFKLDAKGCLEIMQQFLQQNGLTAEQIRTTIQNQIGYGTCNIDTTKWNVKNWKPTPGVNADFWWKAAGYDTI